MRFDADYLTQLCGARRNYLIVSLVSVQNLYKVLCHCDNVIIIM